MVLRLNKLVGRWTVKVCGLMLSATLWLALLTTQARAQNGAQSSPGASTPSAPAASAPQQANWRALLAQELNLTPEQREKMRAIQEEDADALRIARLWERMAQAALDRAIYVENADEKVVAERARDLAAARAELIRLQALRDLKIRRVLTPEQLSRLIELRRQAALANRARLQRNNNQQPSTAQQPANSTGPSTSNNFNEALKQPAQNDNRLTPVPRPRLRPGGRPGLLRQTRP
jgi:Spy/CpxP family protein refolding chaperone